MQTINDYTTQTGMQATFARMLAFAQRHDWGQDAQIIDGGVRVGCDVVEQDGRVWREFAVIDCMSDLRDWAGY